MLAGKGTSGTSSSSFGRKYKRAISIHTTNPTAEQIDEDRISTKLLESTALPGYGRGLGLMHTAMPGRLFVPAGQLKHDEVEFPPLSGLKVLEGQGKQDAPAVGL